MLSGLAEPFVTVGISHLSSIFLRLFIFQTSLAFSRALASLFLVFWQLRL